VAISAAVLAFGLLAAAPEVDPFAFFRPNVLVTDEERKRLDKGEAVAHTLAGEDHEVAVFAAVRVGVDGERLVAWMRRVEDLKKSGYVLSIGRFSDPPRLEDLSTLELDPDELSDVVGCRPGDCGLKLASAEMQMLQTAAAGEAPQWQVRLQQAFRRLVLQRVIMYLAEGQEALPPYADHAAPVRPAAAFSSLLAHSAYLTEHLPAFAGHLGRFPQMRLPDVESFVYWSKERLADHAIISATHVNIWRGAEPGMPETLVAGKEIFATHYVNASLNMTAIVKDESTQAHYLVFVNRSQVDVVGGMFGGLVRWLIQRRVRSEAATVLQGLRQRLESGEPPPK
jgi:hypothetical protein